MTDEARLNLSLQITKDNLQYRSHPTAFNADVTGAKGPTPGAMAATTAGTDVDLSELTSYGWCRIYNLDSTNFVTVGIRDGGEFYPLADVYPGEFTVIQLSQFLGDSFDTGTGTATVDTGNALCIKANTASCDVVVEAFER